jgi:hypothetical protein
MYYYTAMARHDAIKLRIGDEKVGVHKPAFSRWESRGWQLFRKERGFARRAETNGVGRSSAATGGIIANPDFSVSSAGLCTPTKN